MKKVIITAPSLDPACNVSGVSSVAQFIISHNDRAEYVHFQLGKTDHETGLWSRVVRILHSYRDWKRLLAAEPDAIIHYSFPLSAPSLLRDPVFMSYALRHNRKMAVHVHGGQYLTAPHIPLLQKAIMKRVFSWDVPFIVLSEGEKDILQKRWGARNVTVLPNCPEIPGLAVLAERKEQKDDVLTLGYLGRIEAEKGMKELLEACSKLKAEGIPFRLLFAGKETNEGEYIPLYDSELGGNFKYIGVVSGEEKSKFLKALDVFVMPTYFEGLPMALLETMSYGIVPLVTPVGSIPTVVEEGGNGLFLTLKDAGSIVERVKALCSDEAQLCRLGENARATIMRSFSPQRYVETLNGIYDNL